MEDVKYNFPDGLVEKLVGEGECKAVDFGVVVVLIVDLETVFVAAAKAKGFIRGGMLSRMTEVGVWILEARSVRIKFLEVIFKDSLKVPIQVNISGELVY